MWSCTYREHTHSNTLTHTQTHTDMHKSIHMYNNNLPFIFLDKWISHQLGAFETTIQSPTYYIWLDTSPKTHLRACQSEFLLKDEG